MLEEQSQQKYIKMTETSMWRLIASLSLPSVISMLITSVYNMADTYFVADLGDSATGAVSVVFALQSVVQALGYGIGMGCSSLVSRSLGEKDKRSAEKYASSAFAAAVVVGTLLMIVCVATLRPTMRLLGSTETILPYACDYGRIIMFGAPVMCSSFVLNNVLRSQGAATLSMVGLCAGGVVNIVLDPIFIYGCNMGVSGAALATVVSQCVSFLILGSFFVTKRSFVQLSLRSVSLRLHDYFMILKTGFPTICRQGMGSIATATLNIVVRGYGDAAIAAIGIANKIYMLIRSIILGVGQGFQPVAGYNFGAGKYARVRKSFTVAVVFGSVIACVGAIVIGIWPEQIMAIFRDESPEVIAIGGRTLRWMSISLPVLAYSTYVNQLYQSLGYVSGATFLASCRQGIFFVPALFLLNTVLGLSGVEATQAIADVATCIVSIPFQVWFYRKVLKRG